MIEENKIGFIYTIEHVGVDGKVKSTEQVHNIIPTVGVNYILSSAIAAGSQFASWYIGLYTANRTPLATDTMTTLLADCAETALYESATRPEATFSEVTNGAVTTIASPTIFTFTASAS